jgi:hypothetical protein
MVAPLVPVVASITLILPPSVSVPLPVIVEPVVAPQYRVVLVGPEVAPILNVERARVAPPITVKFPETIGIAVPKVVVPELIVRLLNEVKIEAGKVFVAFSWIVPAPGVNELLPPLARAIPLQIKVPPFVITIEPRLLLLPELPSVTMPETVN